MTHLQMKAEGDLVEASSKVIQLQESLEEYALSFEMNKLTDLKRILHDFIKAELIFHLRAVEILTAASTDIGDINVETDYQVAPANETKYGVSMNQVRDQPRDAKQLSDYNYCILSID